MQARALLAVLLLLVAGCSAPTADTTVAPTSGPADTTDVPPDGPLAYEDATIPYDGPRVLERVERLRDLNATGTIRVEEAMLRSGGERDIRDSALGIDPAGAVALGLKTNASVPAGNVLGVTYSGPRVVLRENVDAYPQELVFAHELTHALQYQHDFTAVQIGTSGLLDTDRALAVRAVIEGDAQATAVAYRNRSLSNASLPVVPFGSVTRERWQAAFSGAYYHYGYEYIREWANTTAERNAVLRSPPNSTRALLHPNVNATKPAVADPPRTSDLTPVQYDTVGELGIRLALRANGVEKADAASAAFGWRNDRMTYYDGPDAPVHWRTAWQNESEAGAFAAAWRGLLDSRNATEKDGLLVVPATDTTPRFYTAIASEGETVTVVSGVNEASVRALVQASSSRNSSSSSSTASSDTSDSASSSASLTLRSP